MEVRLTAGGAEEGGEGGRLKVRLTVARRGFHRCLQAISINVHKSGRLSRRAEQGADHIGKIDMC